MNTQILRDAGTRLAIMIASVLLTLLVAEAVLRLANKPRPTISGWRGSGSPLNVVLSEQNQLGFRGQRVEYGDDDFVIVLVGDSFVDAKACAYEWMPERRLQFHLNALGRKVKVFSVGASGYGQDQELLGLQDYFKRFRVDLVVLWETPINDVWNNVFPSSFPASGTPKPTFWIEAGQLRGPSEEMGQPLRETSRYKLVQLWRRSFGWTRDRLWEKYYPPAYKPMSEYKGPVKNDWQERWAKEPDFVGYPNVEKTLLAMALTPRSERMKYGLDLTHKLIQEMERLTISRGAQFVTFTHNPYPVEAEDGVHVFNDVYYRTSRSQYDENVTYINQGFRFFTIPVTIDQWKVGPEDSHLNEHATDQLMRDLARQLESLIPVNNDAHKRIVAPKPE